MLKGGKEKQKTQDGMWVFVASGSARQPHTSAFAFLTFLQVFLFAKVLWPLGIKFSFFELKVFVKTCTCLDTSVSNEYLIKEGNKLNY